MGLLNALQRVVAAAFLLVAWLVVVTATTVVLFFQFLRRPLTFFSTQQTRPFERPAVPGMESVRVQTSRLSLHVLRGANADPSKPLMLFLHGFPENAYSWRDQLAHFSDRFSVVALDMRGFGGSDAPKGLAHYSMDLLCLDVVAVIKACGYQSCVLVGHDWGGMVAWNVAANFPSAVDALVTVCSPHPRAYNEPACFTSAQARRSSYFLLFATSFLPELYLRYCRGREIRKMLLSKPMGVTNGGALTEDDVRFYVDALLRPGRLTAGLNYYRNAMFMPSARAKKFVVKTTASAGGGPGWSGPPTLQLYADSDAAFECGMFENCSIVTGSGSSEEERAQESDDDEAKGSVDGPPSVVLVKLPACSHWAQQDCPDRVNEEIDRFLTTLQITASA